MGKKCNSLLLSFLLLAALRLETLVAGVTVHCPGQLMNWTEARQYCQEKYIDLVTWNTVNSGQLAEWLLEIGVKLIWIGLLRDPEQVSVWKWINLRTGEGISGDDLSQSNNWADGQQSSHCALVGDEDQMWYSDRCSSEHHFYCSFKNRTRYYKQDLSWYKAQHYCYKDMNKFAYLANVSLSNTYQFSQSGWIGLYQEADKTWSWSTDFKSDYRNWAPGEPLTADCGSFDPVTQQWYSNQCSRKLQVVCYGDGLVVVRKNKTWEEALSHCRRLQTPCVGSLKPCIQRYELLSLGNEYDYNYVKERIYSATADEVWIGLRFLAGEWWWMNGQKMKKQGMLPNCPFQLNHCGAISKYKTNDWLTRDCSEKRNFICQRKKIITYDESNNQPVKI